MFCNDWQKLWMILRFWSQMTKLFIANSLIVRSIDRLIGHWIEWQIVCDLSDDWIENNYLIGCHAINGSESCSLIGWERRSSHKRRVFNYIFIKRFAIKHETNYQTHKFFTHFSLWEHIRTHFRHLLIKSLI